MKLILILGVIFLFAICSNAVPSEPLLVAKSSHLLGAKECTWGPSYWCQNITTAGNCKATKHCIQTVWMYQTLPPDHSSICELCLEMVKEARDQLLSNETEEEIKEVFEGSCKLLPVKIVADECCKLADEFIPELVDTLASQMNPQIVCSVSGLCNNERVQDLLEAQESKHAITSKLQGGNNHCEGCHTVLNLVEKKFHQTSRDQVLRNFLQVCGHMGSLSDSCSNVIITYFNDIYKHLEDNLNANEFCLLSGECSAMFHTHANVEITHLSHVGYIPVGEHDDLPCDLCKQLVKHLQDILIANTTEDEFRKVLLGICQQTKSFKEECTNIVNEYYSQIYNFIVNELNGSVMCSMVGICPGPGLFDFDDITPIIPLLPAETVQNPLLTAQPVVPIGHGSTNKSASSLETLEIPQLPIERLMPHTLTLIGNSDLCVFCEYFLHFVQNAITDPTTEEKIKYIVDGACDRLPSTINETCRQFVDTYGPAFIALLAQDIDPSVLCPKLSLCPSLDIDKVHDIEIFMHKNNGEKPNCPLCLFAITSVEELIKNKRTEENIRKALSSLCSHLSRNMANECEDFVQTYTDEVVEALLAELDAQQICVYLKLCEDKKPAPKILPNTELGGHVETNEITDHTANGKLLTADNSNLCVLCEFVISQIKTELKENSTEEEIRDIVHNICSHLPKSISGECDAFAKQYEDMIIELLIQTLDPNEVCTKLKLCSQYKPWYKDILTGIGHLATKIEESVEILHSPQCYFCKMIMTEIEKLLNGSITEDKIIKAVHGVCNVLPKKESKQCNDFINKHGDQIIDFLKMAVRPSEVCSLLFFCSSELNLMKLEINKCSVCEVMIDIMKELLNNPSVDHRVEHILEKTCRALPTKHQQMCRDIVETYGNEIFKSLEQNLSPNVACNKLGICSTQIMEPYKNNKLGANKCVWGPGYWCISEENAASCGTGATQHCQRHVWNK